MSKSIAQWDDVHAIFTNADEEIEPPNKPMVAIIAKSNSKIMHAFPTRAEALEVYDALEAQLRERFETDELAIVYGDEAGERAAREAAEFDSRRELVSTLMRLTLGLAGASTSLDIKTELSQAWREAELGQLPFDEDGDIAVGTVRAMLEDFSTLTAPDESD